LRDPHTLPAYLYTTARNAALSRMRRRGFASNGELIESVQDEAECDDFEVFDNVEAVHHALDQLPLPQREALTLYFLDDLSLDEMAALLNVPVGTVKSRLHYAKNAMRQILSPGDDHVG